MTYRYRILVACALSSLVACGSSSKSDSVQISGTVSGVSTQGARAVVMTAKGRAFSSSIDASGRFRVTIPSGTAFRLVVAGPAAGLRPVVAHVVGRGNGRWLTATSSIDLGVARPATAPGSGLTTKSETADTSGSEDDTETGDDHEDDGADDKLCGAGTSGDAELHADNAPDDSGGDDEAGDKDHEDSVAAKACD